MPATGCYLLPKVVAVSDFTIHLRTEGDGPPPIIRLRRWLKIGRRCFGLVAMRVTAGTSTPDEPKGAAGETGLDGGDGKGVGR